MQEEPAPLTNKEIENLRKLGLILTDASGIEAVRVSIQNQRRIGGDSLGARETQVSVPCLVP